MLAWAIELGYCVKKRTYVSFPKLNEWHFLFFFQIIVQRPLLVHNLYTCVCLTFYMPWPEISCWTHSVILFAVCLCIHVCVCVIVYWKFVNVIAGILESQQLHNFSAVWHKYEPIRFQDQEVKGQGQSEVRYFRRHFFTSLSLCSSWPYFSENDDSFTWQQWHFHVPLLLW